LKHKSFIYLLFQKALGRLNLGSLKIRLWGYFGLFAVILVLILWILQVVFLNVYYEGMKQRETQNIVTEIESLFRNEESISNIRAFATSIYRQSGIFIQIEPVNGSPLVIPLVNFEISTTTDAQGNEVEELPAQRPGSFYPTVYRNEIENLKAQLIESGESYIIKQTIEPETERKTLEYAVFLDVPEYLTSYIGDDKLVLFVFSPLYPQESTAQILQDQLMYVTIIAILLSIILGFYLSRMLTKPLTEITERARELAAGKYGVEFPTYHYSEIKQLAETLSATSNELAETRTFQRDIIANVSHDLKTPLTMIRSYAEMIGDLSGDNPTKRAEHLQVIVEETDRLSALIAELLDISKLQTGELPLNTTSFSMKELIESTINAFQPYVEQDGYTLTFVNKGEGVVRADETRIKQALDNLISNALKYGGKDKVVEITMIEDEDFVRVEITDHGQGIPKRELKHVWERYYQSSTHHSRSDSTGLGLSIVKEILVLHGARFGVISAVRQGSTFWFEIPSDGIDVFSDDVDIPQEPIVLSEPIEPIVRIEPPEPGESSESEMPPEPVVTENSDNPAEDESPVKPE